jgi:chromosome segregation ATPase
MDRLVNADPTVEMLRQANEKLMDRVRTLKDQLADAGDEKEALEEQCKDLRRQADAAVSLAEAVRSYLSWVESPPAGMEPTSHEAIRFRFRSDVEAALRRIEP